MRRNYRYALWCVMATCWLSGCATLRQPGEAAWQTMHMIDTLQTFDLTSDPRYMEVESAWLIGANPDKKTVLAWSIGLSLVHAGVTHLLVENDFPRLSKAWQTMTLTSLCRTVGHNAAIGIHLGQSNAGPDPDLYGISDRWRTSGVARGP